MTSRTRVSPRELPPAFGKVIAALEAAECDPMYQGQNDNGGPQYEARCPSHDDHNASLSAGWNPGTSKVLLTCHAGCDPDEVVAALNLTWKALAPDPVPVAFYDYEDADGDLLMQVVRYEPKNFKQRVPRVQEPRNDVGGDWMWTVRGIDPVPYHLPELIEALAAGEDVVGAEGEKDVDALIIGLGAVATCNAGGAGTSDRPRWTDEFHSVWFKGSTSRVRWVVDRDVPGYMHGIAVAESLERMAGITVELLLSPRLKDAADAVGDYGLDDFIPTTVEALRMLIAEDPSAPPSGDWFPLTELGNAERFIAAHGENVRFVPDEGAWVIWDGSSWRKDDRGEIARLMKGVVRTIIGDLHTSPEKPERVIAWAKASESRAKLSASVALAANELGITMLASDFDQDPMLLNVANGTVDLRTGRLNPHRRQDYCRRIVRVPYDPKATAPTYLAFLKRVQPVRERRDFMQRAAGYSATGSTQEQKLVIALGTGSNGKSTFIETMHDLLGPYGALLPAEALAQKIGNSIPNDIARLDGARFVSVMEFESSVALNERLVKQLTGGDTISARFLYHDLFDFRPKCTIWVSSNHAPVVRGTDDGIWRRFLLLPFEVKIPASEADPTLRERIREKELPGVLRWVVDGAVAWARDGLRPPAAILNATETYRQDSDLMGSFLADVCVLGDRHTVGKKALYSAYEVWCRTVGAKAQTMISFGRALKERADVPLGEDRVGSEKVHHWTGIGLAIDALKNERGAIDMSRVPREPVPLSTARAARESGSDAVPNEQEPSRRTRKVSRKPTGGRS